MIRSGSLKLGRSNRVLRLDALALGFAFILAAPAPSIAEPQARRTSGEDLAWSPPPLPDCTCRAQGKTFQLGEHVCLATPTGFRLAQCELTQNVTNWRFSSDDCVTSSLDKTGRMDRRFAAACFTGMQRRI